MALRAHFNSHHIEGNHSPNKKVNHVFPNFKAKAKFKTATLYQRIPGGEPGQSKVIAKVDYEGTGLENSGEKGHGPVMFTGLKNGEKFVSQHCDGLLKERDDGRFEDGEGNIYQIISESETAQDDSGKDSWDHEISEPDIIADNSIDEQNEEEKLIEEIEKTEEKTNNDIEIEIPLCEDEDWHETTDYDPEEYESVASFVGRTKNTAWEKIKELKSNLKKETKEKEMVNELYSQSKNIVEDSNVKLKKQKKKFILFKCLVVAAAALIIALTFLLTDKAFDQMVNEWWEKVHDEYFFFPKNKIGGRKVYVGRRK